MVRRVIFTCATLIIAVTTAATAGIIKIEVPADVSAEDVLNPTADVEGRLEALMRDELSAHAGLLELGPVAFTKDGEIIAPDVEPAEADGWSDNRLTFQDVGDYWMNNAGSWEAAYWHLREVGQPDYNGVYALAQDIFGYPFVHGEVEVEWDPTFPGEGCYNVSLGRIYLKNWRNWNNHQDPDFCYDAAVLTRCMLQAWHHSWQCEWDHFGSMRRAAWMAIHDRLADDGYELGFSELYHGNQAYYKCLENYNTEAFGTRMKDWADAGSEIDDRIKYWRYGAAGYCWWKVYNKQHDFMNDFNGYLYAEIMSAVPPGVPEDYKDYKAFADAADNNVPIEGRDFSSEWFFDQPILRCDHWCDDVCAVAVDRTTARILAYRRYIYVYEGNGIEAEIAHSGARVHTEKFDWQGNSKGYYVVDVNNFGYGEWDFPVHDPDKSLIIKSEYTLGGVSTVRGSCVGIDSDAAYGGDALYGVVTDALVDGGTVSIVKEGDLLATVAVSGKAFRWPAMGAIEAGEYELTYTPPGMDGPDANPQLVVKDGANYFVKRGFISDVTPIDADGNGILDSAEADLAAKFCPEMVFHGTHIEMPHNVDISLNTGCYGRYLADSDGYYWDEPGPGETMRDIFEKYKTGGGYHAKDFVSFGTNDHEIHQYQDWPVEYNLAKAQFDQPTSYYNVFKCQGKPVIQYWFFYPFNMWADDHEGDWEHINVRASSTDPARALLEEVVFYIHEYRKSLPHDAPQLDLVDDTHPFIRVGGHARFFGAAETSGASYWQNGTFHNVGINAIDEEVNTGEYSAAVRWSELDLIWIGRAKTNENAWWLEFPGMWGRQWSYLDDISAPPHWPMDPPPGPWWHECWEDYQHYNEYEADSGGPVAAAPSPDGPGPADPASPAEAEPYGPPVAVDAPSPLAGDPLLPSVGDRVSPGASAPDGGDADVPGGDFPPDGGPAGLYPASTGGDALSPGAVASPAGSRGPLTAASPAAPLSCSPNPVTGVATVSFKLEKAGRVYLAVYDLSGRRVATLAGGSYAAGCHAASWNADVPTGVYIYRLQAGDRVAVKKVVVAK